VYEGGDKIDQGRHVRLESRIVYQAVFDCDTLGQRIVKSKCSSMDGTTYAPLEATNSEQSLSPDWM
jgi:hypothetical protein